METARMMIRRATEKDVARIAELYDEARRSLRAAGVDQWQDGYPDADAVLKDIDSGRAYVVTDEGRVIATAAVYVGHEPTYDVIRQGRWGADVEEYGIIHRIAVDPAARGMGVASEIMDYCAAMASGAGRTWARCDTHRDNLTMRHTLEKNGYICRGVIYLKDGAERVAYDREINKDNMEGKL